jgi:protein-S-isoprenylcysteine O-methyltransferase Ste14
MPDVQALRLFGLAMLVCGSLFIIWTGIELGRQYSVYITLQEDHKLVTSGRTVSSVTRATWV